MVQDTGLDLPRLGVALAGPWAAAPALGPLADGSGLRKWMHGIGITSGGAATGTSGAGIAGSSPITGAVSGAPVTTVAVVGCARTDSSQGQGIAIGAAPKGSAAARIASTLAANR